MKESNEMQIQTEIMEMTYELDLKSDELSSFISKAVPLMIAALEDDSYSQLTSSYINEVLPPPSLQANSYELVTLKPPKQLNLQCLDLVFHAS